MADWIEEWPKALREWAKIMHSIHRTQTSKNPFYNVSTLLRCAAATTQETGDNLNRPTTCNSMIPNQQCVA